MSITVTAAGRTIGRGADQENNRDGNYLKLIQRV